MKLKELCQIIYPSDSFVIIPQANGFYQESCDMAHNKRFCDMNVISMEINDDGSSVEVILEGEDEEI